jgi:DNA polymerase iota
MEEEDFTDFKLPLSTTKHEKVIIHIDIDCFYAQVEILLNPSLKGKPIGIQQKNIVVTSNYIAREMGVQKLMSVKSAKEICPSLILVNGEDLKKYREMSEKIYQELQTFSPLVEKLGLDENFIDVTEQINNLSEGGATKTVIGHVYTGEAGDKKISCTCGCEERLAIGSSLAQEMRNQLKSELGISCCAGIATNKLLAKVVGATHKPNQQTTVLPSSALELIASLKSAKNLPGIGSCTSKKLEEIGVVSVEELRQVHIAQLNRVLGVKLAHQIQQLSYGIDDCAVKITDKPKSIGAEDGFPIIRTIAEVRTKMKTLLNRVLDLVNKDGRQPSTVKLTVRKVFHQQGSKSNLRESRQTSIDGFSSTAGLDAKIVNILMTLFEKIIATDGGGWQVTLLGISFSGLQAKADNKNSLLKYFGSRQNNDSQLPPTKRARMDETLSNTTPDIPVSSSSNLEEQILTCPKEFDPTVFSQLPRDIQMELISSSRVSSQKKTSPTSNKPRNLLQYFRKL